jgi:hypothetical protein
MHVPSAVGAHALGPEDGWGPLPTVAKSPPAVRHCVRALVRRCASAEHRWHAVSAPGSVRRAADSCVGQEEQSSLSRSGRPRAGSSSTACLPGWGPGCRRGASRSGWPSTSSARSATAPPSRGSGAPRPSRGPIRPTGAPFWARCPRAGAGRPRRPPRHAAGDRGAPAKRPSPRQDDPRLA